MYEPTHNSNEAVEEHINKPGRHVMFLSADWCGDCKAIKPFIQTIKDEVTQTAEWFDADRDENIDVARYSPLPLTGRKRKTDIGYNYHQSHP